MSSQRSRGSLCGKSSRNSEKSWAARVLFGESTSAGLPTRSMTAAIVNVLPEPVIPSSVWCGRSARRPRTRRSINALSGSDRNRIRSRNPYSSMNARVRDMAKKSIESILDSRRIKREIAERLEETIASGSELLHLGPTGLPLPGEIREHALADVLGLGHHLATARSALVDQLLGLAAGVGEQALGFLARFAHRALVAGEHLVGLGGDHARMGDVAAGQRRQRGRIGFLQRESFLKFSIGLTIGDL